MDRPIVVRVALFLATVVAAWGVLSLGTEDDQPTLAVGEVADQEYQAERDATVEDTRATEALRQEARDSVAPIQTINESTEDVVVDEVEQIFTDVATLVIGSPPTQTPQEVPELPDVTTSSTEPPAEGASTTTTEIPAAATIAGVVFLDVNGDGIFNPEVETEAQRHDVGLSGVSVHVTSEGEVDTVSTGELGAWQVEVSGPGAVITVDALDPEIPNGYVIGTENLAQAIPCEAGATCVAESIGFVANLRPVDEVESALSGDYVLSEPTLDVLATTAADDVIRAALGLPLHLRDIQDAAVQRVLQEFGLKVTPENLTDVRNKQLSTPPAVFHDDTQGRDIAAGDAAGELVAAFIQANYLEDRAATEDARVAAADAVPKVMMDFVEGQTILLKGDVITQLHLDALEATGAIDEPGQAEGGLLAVLAVLVGVLGLYLSRFRPEVWTRPRMVALLGILLVLAAAAVRATVVLAPTTSLYLLPAVAFGFMTAVLYDSRIAVLMAIAVGVVTAVGTEDIGIAVYGVLATLAPIPFVSSVSSRGAFRNAVVFSSLTAAVVAAATSWMFHVRPDDSALPVVGLSVAWAFGISVIASLVGLAALQFFESAFDITTSLSLLDLTDRNHKALVLLQAEAFGTFNHSLMVGTLADAASRAIGADPLLARAMAYYHDIGKTKNPTYFIENQFGISNPHDEISPWESAEIVRKHVTDGIALAREFKIPSDVAAAIVSHHGDGIIRYFYEKARTEVGHEVDPDDFRHVGHKPRSAETAIVMLADSLEAACRAVFQSEEPSPSAIEKVVGRVVDEKMEDGQLQESPLTLAQLTKIRQAFVESLVGHYHQRISYPNFPGS